MLYLKGGMTEERDKIIVFKNYDTSMEANLAKTKLDAYGIPCFLTNENLANLYPIQNQKFSAVRLHLFEKDAEQAILILNEKIKIPEDELLHCPRCRSTRIDSGYTRKPGGLILSIVFSIFVALFPPRTVYRCLDCDHEFKR
jgi:DNA-directed RNA polymerase subunit RPC12/RpoP